MFGWGQQARCIAGAIQGLWFQRLCDGARPAIVLQHLHAPAWRIAVECRRLLCIACCLLPNKADFPLCPLLQLRRYVFEPAAANREETLKAVKEMRGR